MIEIKQIQDCEEWEEFVLKQEFTLFTQSATYAEFARDFGEKSWLFGIYENDKLVGGSSVIGVRAKRGSYLTLHYGPILDYENRTLFADFASFLKKFAKEQRYSFVRMSPFIDDAPKYRSMFSSAGFIPAPMHTLAENTWILDLDKTKEQIMRGMKKNHRNLISRCEREGVVIKSGTGQQMIDRLNKMHDAVAKRHKFQRFSKKFMEKEFKNFSLKGQAIIFEAYLPDGRIDASSIIIFYGNMACYRHSASLNNDKRLPTSYLIQWEAIKEAKKFGLKYYNFWGIAPKNAQSTHPFYGISHFKRGFGGRQKDLLHCHDMQISWKYNIAKIIETLRSIKRGFRQE